MTDAMGPVAYGQEEEPIFIGKEIARHKDYAESTATSIDNAIKAILDRAVGRAMEILTRNREQLDTLAEELITKETLDDAEIRQLLGFPQRQQAPAVG
jgi:cell division protease FtsH